MYDENEMEAMSFEMIEARFLKDFKAWVAKAKLPDGSYNETDKELAS